MIFKYNTVHEENWLEFWHHHEPAMIYAGSRLFCMGDREPWPCTAAKAKLDI